MSNKEEHILRVENLQKNTVITPFYVIFLLILTRVKRLLSSVLLVVVSQPYLDVSTYLKNQPVEKSSFTTTIS